MRELLNLIKGVKTNGGLVAVSFIVRRVQPCKERAHVGFDFKGDTDGTRERVERLTKDDVLGRAAELFAPSASFSMSRLFLWPIHRSCSAREARNEGRCRNGDSRKMELASLHHQ